LSIISSALIFISLHQSFPIVQAENKSQLLIKTTIDIDRIMETRYVLAGHWTRIPQSSGLKSAL